MCNGDIPEKELIDIKGPRRGSEDSLVYMPDNAVRSHMVEALVNHFLNFNSTIGEPLTWEDF